MPMLAPKAIGPCAALRPRRPPPRWRVCTLRRAEPSWSSKDGSSMTRSVVALVLCAAGANAQEFEAATIKPSPPPNPVMNVRGCRGGPQTADPALFSCNAVPLWGLASLAYRVPQYQLAVPKWMQDPQLVFEV